MRAIVVHGGAGDWRESKLEAAAAGVLAGAERGRAILEAGGSALDAVIAAVRILEDDPLFNAGTGGALSIDGRIELDACVMTGHDLAAGAVAGIERVRHPIEVALAVMRETDHVLLAGEGATRFARALGVPDHDPETPDRREAFEAARARLADAGDSWLPRLRELLDRYPELGHGTVGAVAVDADGRTAAATSTGGVVLKLVGRVGDAPFPGAGTYANPWGAAGATGRGEIAMRCLSTRRVCELIERGATAQQAVSAALGEATALGPELALIAVDRDGGVGVAHATRHLPHAVWTPARGLSAAVAAAPSIP
ncbi:MAG: isoaspartyl peptidase/L-asparaginase [Myxococcales bacterium]|nr:isoaspartyl peptidase/L-asparaginase [Myxococcales bacterium]